MLIQLTMLSDLCLRVGIFFLSNCPGVSHGLMSLWDIYSCLSSVYHVQVVTKKVLIQSTHHLHLHQDKNLFQEDNLG